ncbi:pyridoxamine 5'-phosphate oxidase family protein [Campylobacter armoricus]|uniref:YhbP domain-containing protein n=1 Tax=Campylobacter armoricus TaxID=2505970 RepID=A0A7L5HQ36_9BACT|nr:pyridoxamine 5'-phosphate oxidase family protein [Campylobacter armoricus]QKF79344.1 YhbP domain-containing protein [Campylobacter armoricus]
MDERIKKFIHSQKLLSLSMLDEDGGIYCASCYYAFDEKKLALIFASEEHTKHIQLAYKTPKIAVNIALNTDIINLIKGVQIKAIFQKATKEQEILYYEKFPFAKFAKASIFASNIYWAKYTDNKILLSKKLEFFI